MFACQQQPKKLYKILSLSPDATSSEVKKVKSALGWPSGSRFTDDCSAGLQMQAYRELALRYHPDKCSEPSAELVFKIVGEAYDTLCDETRRKVSLTTISTLLLTMHSADSACTKTTVCRRTTGRVRWGQARVLLPRMRTTTGSAGGGTFHGVAGLVPEAGTADTVRRLSSPFRITCAFLCELVVVCGIYS